MRDRKFKGYLKIIWVELPNNELGTHTIAEGDWKTKRNQITKKPRKYYVSCNLKLASGSVHHVNISFQDKSVKQDIKVLMQEAFNIAKQDLTEEVRLFESYFIITA